MGKLFVRMLDKNVILISLIVLNFLALCVIAIAQSDISSVSTKVVSIPSEAIKSQLISPPVMSTTTETSTSIKPIEIEIRKAEEIQSMPIGCKKLCGDGVCQEVVCLAVGCPCPETRDNCPEDCRAPSAAPVTPTITLPAEANIKIDPKMEKPLTIEKRPVEFKGIENPSILVDVKPNVPPNLPTQVSSIAQSTVTVKIDIDKEQKITSVKVGEVVALTKESLKFENASLKVETPEMEILVNVMPNVAAGIATAINLQNVKEIELKIVGNKAIYEIEGTKEARLLLIIPVSIPITTQVSVESGKVEKIEKPWWSFLAW